MHTHVQSTDPGCVTCCRGAEAASEEEDAGPSGSRLTSLWAELNHRDIPYDLDHRRISYGSETSSPTAGRAGEPTGADGQPLPLARDSDDETETIKMPESILQLATERRENEEEGEEREDTTPEQQQIDQPTDQLQEVHDKPPPAAAPGDKRKTSWQAARRDSKAARTASPPGHATPA